VNNFGHSIFRDITLSMNGVLMTEQSNTYYYRAYLETLLNFSRDEGATMLAPQGWVNQLNVIAEMGATGANSDVPTGANWSGNTELRALTSRLLEKHWHTFIIRPHLPPLRTGKLLVPNVQMDFELFLNPNSVYLMGTPNKGTLNAKKFPAIHQGDIKVSLLMRKVTLNASVYVRLQKERQLDSVFVGRFPDRVMVGLLHSNTFSGDLQGYPYAFEKFGVTQIRQTLNGEEYPYRTLQLTGAGDYEDLLEYDRFLQAMGAYNEDKIPILLPGDWGQGNNCPLFMCNNVPSAPTINRNAHYIVAFKNPRDQTGIRTILLQAPFPTDGVKSCAYLNASLFLIPAAIAAAKAAAAGAISGAAGYGAKKAIQAATRKKKVGK
ncbi:unnamed protein product, partial [Porites evermanni]